MRLIVFLSLLVLCSCGTHKDYIQEQSDICTSKGLYPHVGYSQASNGIYVTCGHRE